jgi:hypothetical protein
MVRLIRNNADHSLHFLIFAWSSQPLVDALKVKWEGTRTMLEGERTSFIIRGVFDGNFWNQFWSASVDMLGRVAKESSVNNPNRRWKYPADVHKSNEDAKLHCKTMLVDAGSDSDPTVIIGSTNWSKNGQDINDENMLIVHDRLISNMFLQEFFARYRAAGAAPPPVSQVVGPYQGKKIGTASHDGGLHARHREDAAARHAGSNRAGEKAAAKSSKIEVLP